MKNTVNPKDLPPFTQATARELDASDSLRLFQKEFLFPQTPDGKPYIYLCGNSLGLQPKRTREYVDAVLEDWAKMGVEGHFHATRPWWTYPDSLAPSLARLVGAQEDEVIPMNALTVNLHLLLTSFYQPTPERFKIVIEGGAFPSDRYAALSHIHLHGLDPEQALVELQPREGETALRTQDILDYLDRESSQIALVLLGGVQYLTGQAFELKTITEKTQKIGCRVALDLAHAIGNIELHLHDWNVDFAVWCSYKYLNAGPGAVGGAFIHNRHAKRTDLPRLAGWWGHTKDRRLLLEQDFVANPGVQGWQLSTPPAIQMAALRASLELFDRATFPALLKKSRFLTGFLEQGLKSLGYEILTPQQRGAQISLRVGRGGKDLVGNLKKAGVIADFREPDVMRLAPSPLYNSYTEIWDLIQSLKTLRSN